MTLSFFSGRQIATFARTKMTKTTTTSTKVAAIQVKTRSAVRRQAEEQRVERERVERVEREYVDKYRRSNGVWQFQYETWETRPSYTDIKYAEDRFIDLVCREMRPLTPEEKEKEKGLIDGRRYVYSDKWSLEKSPTWTKRPSMDELRRWTQ